MSGLDLTAAVEAARQAIDAMDADLPEIWAEAADVIGTHAARRAVAAAAPLIEAQVREQVAREIGANLVEHALCDQAFDDGYQFASEVAASIARGAK